MQTTFEIRDQGTGDRKLQITVTDEGGSLNIYPQGYGDFSSADGHGTPIFVEIWEGRLRLVTFADINEQEPVVTDLESAKETNRKTEGEPKTERISIMPEFSQEQAAEMKETLEKKANLEYLCYMMLKSLHDNGLELVLKRACKQDIIEPDTLAEFYGDKPEDGACEAGGYTVKGLLKEWQETTEKMLSMVGGQK